MKTNLLFLIPLVLFSSCLATHYGAMSTAPITKPVQYVDVAYGFAETTRILGFGGLSKDAIALDAKKDLFRNRPLVPNETYTNFIIDYKNTYGLFYATTKVTMSADVINYDPDVASEIYSDSYKNRILSKQLTSSFYQVGDTVICNVVARDLDEAIVVSIINENELRLLHEDGNSSYTDIFNVLNIYSKSKSTPKYRIGDQYDGFFSGKIIAVGIDGLVVEAAKGKGKKYNCAYFWQLED